MQTTELRTVYRSTPFRLQLAITVVALVFALMALARFLTVVEHRPGVAFADPLLALIPPVDLTWLTFGLIYCALVAAIVYLVRHPLRLLTALQAYTALVLVRIAAMYLLPLDPPPDMIPLADPLVELFGSDGVTLSRDLFFSGHTSTLFLLALVVGNRWLRTVFFGCTALVGVCVIVQHVHYSIDVLAAPFFTYGCFAAVRAWNGALQK